MSNDGRVGAPRRSDQERRKHLRKKCFLPARLVTAAGSFDCDVLDISQGGAKVEVGIEVADEQAVTLIIKSIGTYAGLVSLARRRLLWHAVSGTAWDDQSESCCSCCSCWPREART